MSYAQKTHKNVFILIIHIFLKFREMLLIGNSNFAFPCSTRIPVLMEIPQKLHISLFFFSGGKERQPTVTE